MKTRNLLTASMILAATLFLSADAWSAESIAVRISQANLLLNRLTVDTGKARTPNGKLDCQKKTQVVIQHRDQLKNAAVGRGPVPGPLPFSVPASPFLSCGP